MSLAAHRSRSELDLQLMSEIAQKRAVLCGVTIIVHGHLRAHNAVMTASERALPSPTNPNLETRHSRMSSTCVDVCARWISHAASASASRNRTLSQTSPGTASGESPARRGRSRLTLLRFMRPIRHFAAIYSSDARISLREVEIESRI